MQTKKTGVHSKLNTRINDKENSHSDYIDHFKCIQPKVHYFYTWGFIILSEYNKCPNSLGADVTKSGFQVYHIEHTLLYLLDVRIHSALL